MKYHGYIKQRLIDDASRLVAFGIRSVRKKRKFPNKVRKIIIFKLGSIGDSILCLPLIRTLKKKTNAKIIVVHSGENKDVFLGHKFIDERILLGVTSKNFFNISKSLKRVKGIGADVAIDLSYSGNSSAILSSFTSKYNIGFFNKCTPSRNKLFDGVLRIDPKEHVVLSYFRVLEFFGKGYSSKDIWLEKIHYGMSEKKIVKKLLKNGKGYIGVHCCHQIGMKSWPKKEFVKLIDYLIDRKKKIILVGSPKEQDKTKSIYDSLKNKKPVINLSGKTTIPQLAALINRMDLFIANDGGLMHLAAAMDTTTIGIFGPETPIRYAPFNEKSFAFYKNWKGDPLIKAYESKWPEKNLTNKNLWVNSIEVINFLDDFLK